MEARCRGLSQTLGAPPNRWRSTRSPCECSSRHTSPAPMQALRRFATSGATSRVISRSMQCFGAKPSRPANEQFTFALRGCDMHIVRNPTPSVHSLAFAAVLLMTVAACMDSHSPTGVPSAIASSFDVIGSDVEFGARNYNLTSFDISTLALTATSNLVPPNPVIPNNPYVPADPYRTFSATFTT